VWSFEQYQVFAGKLDELLEELNEVLVA